MRLLALILIFIPLFCDASSSVVLDFAEAVRGDAEKAAAIAERFRQGFDVKKNDAIAISWYKYSAERGFAPAMNRYALWLQTQTKPDKDQMKESSYWLEKAASLGNASAMHNLGRSWHYGLGRDVNVEKAIECYLKAISAGYDFSNLELARAYMKRKRAGDDALAVKALLSVADENAEAADLLARHYLEGNGVNVSFDAAIKYFYVASSKGLPQSKFSLYILYRDKKTSKISERDAIKYLSEAADSEYRIALEEYGMYLADEGGKPEDSTALFAKASLLGSSSAQYYLAYHLLEGIGVKADKDLGLAMMRYAASNGSSEAKLWINSQGSLDQK